jgi:hypothetical protein
MKGKILYADYADLADERGIRQENFYPHDPLNPRDPCSKLS